MVQSAFTSNKKLNLSKTESPQSDCALEDTVNKLV